MSCKLEPAIWSRGTGQRLPCIPISKKYTVNQGCMSLSTHYLEDGRHVARLRRRRRCAYVPTSNTASHDNHEKINSWVSFGFHIWAAYGARLGGSSGLRSSAIVRSRNSQYIDDSDFRNLQSLPVKNKMADYLWASV